MQNSFYSAPFPVLLYESAIEGDVLDMGIDKVKLPVQIHSD